ncbi:MAG: DNA alkylation repair protein, partial [Rickettsiaceae bacterium]|nr:DNA alkylation repair protein [Rickettsiaceae bacterium]
MFFKTGAGSYGSHDKFLGVKVPAVRKIVNTYYKSLSLEEIQTLISSEFNEERLFALLVLVKLYNKDPEKIYNFYIDNIHYVNNWNLVDLSARPIVGAYFADKKDKSYLLDLAKSKNLWERRIAIVSTWFFIAKCKKLNYTFEIAKMLFQDKEDLIHKATGWMLREAGKVDAPQLKLFLDENTQHMPRTMLRYSIEKFTDEDRKYYMTKPRAK